MAVVGLSCCDVMHRKKILDLLTRYSPTNVDEVCNKQRFLAFAEQYSSCFNRDCLPGHFTGSCWLENYDKTRVLLTKHKIFKDWLQLGGHADGDPDILGVALKEAYEESGLKNIEIVFAEIFDTGYHFIPEYKGIPAHYHYDVRFLFRASDPDEEIQMSDESDDLKWFDQSPTNNVEVNRMFEKWKSLRNTRL
jgi:8-oxo-dGTP pyrophosphatase MutT (NUDIX family)